MSLFLIAISLSIDALGIGIAYGIRNIKIPLAAKSIICGFTIAVTTLSVIAGKWAASFLPTAYGAVIGAAILVGIGVWILGQAKKEEKNPLICDKNKSNVIEPREAVSLGAALSIDSLGAGFAGAVAGLGHVSIPVMTVVFQMLFLCAGGVLGTKIRRVEGVDDKIWSYVSGAALVFLGIIRVLNAI